MINNTQIRKKHCVNLTYPSCSFQHAIMTHRVVLVRAINKKRVCQVQADDVSCMVVRAFLAYEAASFFRRHSFHPIHPMRLNILFLLLYVSSLHVSHMKTRSSRWSRFAVLKTETMLNHPQPLRASCVLKGSFWLSMRFVHIAHSFDTKISHSPSFQRSDNASRCLVACGSNV